MNLDPWHFDSCAKTWHISDDGYLWFCVLVGPLNIRWLRYCIFEGEQDESAFIYQWYVRYRQGSSYVEGIGVHINILT